MHQYLIELSKYFILIFMLLYMLVSICYFGVRSDGARRAVYAFQRIFMLFMQFSCFLTLTLVSQDYRYLVFFTMIQFFIFGMIFLVTICFDKADGYLLNHMCMLLGIGLCMIARLSGIGTQTRFLASKALRQYVIAAVSLFIAMLVAYLFLKLNFLRKLSLLYAAAGIALLSAVLVLGSVTHGSKISYTLFGITFQPSEFVKIIFVFFLASALWKKASFGRVFLTAAAAGLHVVILTVSRDLGSAVIFFVAFVIIVFAASGNFIYPLLGILGGGAASYAAYRIFDHVRVRVLAWWDPWTYIDDQGYQVTQSLFAVGSGNWFGMGLLKGNPKAIPFVEVDMIFSSICEEMGVLFGICVIMICIFCFLEIVMISLKTEDMFYRLIAFGIGAVYIFQVFLTIGGGIKFIPLTGITLPFVSYGGSSVMTSMLMFFIVQAIHIRYREQEINIRQKPEEQPQEEELQEASDDDPSQAERQETHDDPAQEELQEASGQPREEKMQEASDQTQEKEIQAAEEQDGGTEEQIQQNCDQG